MYRLHWGVAAQRQAVSFGGFLYFMGSMSFCMGPEHRQCGPCWCLALKGRRLGMQRMHSETLVLPGRQACVQELWMWG